jgi:hypothetical protein
MMKKQLNHYPAHDLAQIGVPVAIVHSEHDEFIERKDAEYLARSIPNAESVIFTRRESLRRCKRPSSSTSPMLALLGKTPP